jgi:hypothetical protein
LRRFLLEQHGCQAAVAVLGCKFPTISTVCSAKNLAADTVWHRFARYRALWRDRSPVSDRGRNEREARTLLLKDLRD